MSRGGMRWPFEPGCESEKKSAVGNMWIRGSMRWIRGLRTVPRTEGSLNTVLPERARLPLVPKVPSRYSVIKIPKTQRELFRLRGEELVHNDLILGQFGIMALTGGYLKHPHFELMRMNVGHHIKGTKGFAIYRVDPPHRPETVKGTGKRYGGGKPSIDHYSTPVRAGRIILEIGGVLSWDHVRFWLKNLANKMPFDAIPVNVEIIKRFKAEEERLRTVNQNPVTFEWLVRNNIFDCQTKLSPYDKKLFGRYVYKDKTLNKKWNEIRQSKYPHRF